MRTFFIGSDKSCDIHLIDRSISLRHAELVITSNKKLFLTDCVSETGTYVWRNDWWNELQQDFVQFEERIRFGNAEMRGSELFQYWISANKVTQNSAPVEGNTNATIVSGAVRRNEYGQPVRQE